MYMQIVYGEIACIFKFCYVGNSVYMQIVYGEIACICKLCMGK